MAASSSPFYSPTRVTSADENSERVPDLIALLDASLGPEKSRCSPGAISARLATELQLEEIAPIFGTLLQENRHRNELPERWSCYAPPNHGSRSVSCMSSCSDIQ